MPRLSLEKIGTSLTKRAIRKRVSGRLANLNQIENALAGEVSPYLLQHAHNPVAWMPWGAAVWDRAKAENKPVFLSIGYSTCHWCHVMERESFEDEKTAEILNREFIPVKVDREERPDVDRIYMTAVQAMTGQGGWPLSAWLIKKTGLAGEDGESGVVAHGADGLLRLLDHHESLSCQVQYHDQECQESLSDAQVGQDPNKEDRSYGL